MKFKEEQCNGYAFHSGSRVSEITSKEIKSKIQCFKIGNEHDLVLGLIPVLH